MNQRQIVAYLQRALTESVVYPANYGDDNVQPSLRQPKCDGEKLASMVRALTASLTADWEDK